jgi:ATP-dependent DNA ligase
MAIRINRLLAGFVIAAQPDWVHEIKHDGYRIIVCRDGPTVRLYSRSAYDRATGGDCGGCRRDQMPTPSPSTARRWWRGLMACLRSEELPRREAARTPILYAFDLIELDSEDLRRSPFLDRKGALALR